MSCGLPPPLHARECLQAVCEELATRVHSLAEENISLRSEMIRLQEECSNTVAHNTVLQVRSCVPLGVGL